MCDLKNLDVAWESRAYAIDALAGLSNVLALADSDGGVLELWRLDVALESRAYAIDALAGLGNMLALADSDGGLLELWTLDPPRLYRRLGEHRGVTALQFCSWDGREVLMTGDRKGWVRVLSLDGGQLTAFDLDESVTALASLDDGFVAVGTTRGVVVLAGRGLAS